MPYQSVVNQLQMALNGVRNEAYLAALKDLVTPDTVVLDLGAGLGTLGLMAAKLGAKHVYMVEPEAVIKLIPKIAQDNGIADKVTCIQGRIEDVILPEKVDIIISVFTGNFLLEEDLLPSLYFARDHYLKDNGILLPNAAEMWVVPISDEHYYQRQIGRVSEPHHGLDFSSLHPYLSNGYKRVNSFNKEHYLCAPKRLKRIEFSESSVSQCQDSIEFVVKNSAQCHGFIGWLDIDLGKKTLSSAPHSPKTHWSPLFFPCDSAIAIENGERVTIKVDKKIGTPWNWSIKTRTTNQQQSELRTWLKMPPKKQQS